MADIKSFSLTELKALAYDEMLKIEISRQNLVVINNEIQIRVAQIGKESIVEKTILQ